MKTSIGKNTLGGGSKMNVELKNYNRSTHDLSRIIRTTMSVGTLVPTFNELILPGDTFTIKTRSHVLTHPTIGPLFGSFKVQNDFFVCPIRLYNAMLHNNTLGVGLDMSKVKLPIISINTAEWVSKWLEGSNGTIKKEVNPSSIMYYLGKKRFSEEDGTKVKTCALKLLSYYDIFKNYYANKQEKNFYIINGTTKVNYNYTTTKENNNYVLDTFSEVNTSPSVWAPTNNKPFSNDSYTQETTMPNVYFGLQINGYQGVNLSNVVIKLNLKINVTNNEGKVRQTVIRENCSIQELLNKNIIRKVTVAQSGGGEFQQIGFLFKDGRDTANFSKATFTQNDASEMNIEGSNYFAYPLTAIDDMRENILKCWNIEYDAGTESFINELFKNYKDEDGDIVCKMATPQNGLVLKTYQSDINTNWINTEWIDGDNGINAITAIDTSSGSFTLDTFNLAKKVYDMLNRIAISDGTYNAWIQTVYTSGGLNHVETPVYIGGSSLEIEFQEVINQSGSDEEPLGSLAGRGIATNQKGGEIKFKADEPAYIICITSITPRVDYYQGDKWDVDLKTMDDLHKPQLDGIGFQDRLYKYLNASCSIYDKDKTIGKQPAWINYMTSINETAGNFALIENEGWMCLNRVFKEINSYTTYVQPHLWNNIFADTDINAQNFWVQIYFDTKARRVMSAKQIPNV